jgi:hypothetical protein
VKQERERARPIGANGANGVSPPGAVPGRTTLVAAAERHPAVPHAAAPGRATLTEGLPPARGASLLDGWAPVWEAIDPGEYEHLAGGGDAKPRAPAPAPSAPKPAGAEQRGGDAGLAAWAGAGKVGAIFQNDTVESFVDGASADSVGIRTAWTLAEYEAYELRTTAVLEVRRELRIRLARGAWVLAKSRARAWLDADRLPNDVHAALHAPARLIKHEGCIFVADDRGTHLMRSLPHPFTRAQSIAELLADEPMLGLATDPQQRVREADRFVAVTVPQHDANLAQLEGIVRDAPSASLGLTRYVRAKLGYESPPEEALAIGRHMIHRIEALARTATGYEGTALQRQLGALAASFQALVARAERAQPADKDTWDHAADAARAVGHAVAGVGVAVQEVAAMARDLGLWVLDEIAHVLGRDVDWTAASSFGQAYQSGKSTGEIFQALVEGIVGSFQDAIEHAARGDYSRLMDLGAELALDVAIGVATGGAAVPAAAARRTGVGGRLAAGALALTEEAASSLAARVRALLAKSRQALAEAPAEARGAIHGAEDVFEGLLEGLTKAVRVADTGTGTRLAVLDPGAIPRAIQRVRGARAIECAASAMTKLRGGAARAQGQRVVGKLEQLAGQPGMAHAIHALARRLADGKDKARLVAALKRVLDAWRLDNEVLARVMRRASDAADPAEFLDDVTWTLSHKGLSTAAREGLIRHAGRRKEPLDLRWLRELTELPDQMLEFMALDPATHWYEFMKVSARPSDYFPSSVKKLLTPDDYARAAGKLRGVAGELVFVVEGIELPGDLKIVGRQVQAGRKAIDFMLQDARGNRAMLEVKAWSRKTWQRELAVDLLNLPARSAASRMIEQLQAARATKQSVYLAVPDTIGEDLGRLRRLLDRHQLEAVKIIQFPEAKLQGVAAKLRASLVLASGVALAITDQVAEAHDEQE